MLGSLAADSDQMKCDDIRAAGLDGGKIVRDAQPLPVSLPGKREPQPFLRPGSIGFIPGMIDNQIIPFRLTGEIAVDNLRSQESRAPDVLLEGLQIRMNLFVQDIPLPTFSRAPRATGRGSMQPH